MKKSIIILVTSIMLLATVQTTKAQFTSSEGSPKTFIGVGTSINEIGYVGFAIEAQLVNRLALVGHAGVGSWGYKLGGGLQYYLKKSGYGSAMNIGYTYATGLNNFKYSLETEPYGDKEDVTLDLLGTSTVNVAYAYNFRIRGKNKLALTAGYSIPLETNHYNIKTSGVELNDNSQQVLDIIAPGGFILGVKYMFGIN
jgi:hypothetical protein